MSIEPGQALSRYRLIEKIGEGGMGVVWKALDTKLEREVAIKFLPEEFAREPDRLLRFEREAKALASLNHPNIAAIHGLERSDDIHFLALELVPGRTLMKMLEAGPLAVDDMLPLGLQIAEAMEAAHDTGIIHRDLKPANIKVTDDGQVKVLDFGLAKVLEGEPGSISSEADPALSPTLTSTGTRAGMILGTAAYMSPEQARGRQVDKRADIWAFGCVLYEMLSGRQTFEGETASDKLAAVLKSEPDWNSLPSSVPARICRLLSRCLEKNLKQRLRDIGEARIEIQNVMSGEAIPHATPAESSKKLRSGLMLAVGLAVGAALASAALLWIQTSREFEPKLRKFEISVGSHSPMPVISPDGNMIVYSDKGRLWIRDLDNTVPREIAGSEEGHTVFWSPDSKWIGFAQGLALWKVPAGGGTKTAICHLDRGVSPLGGGAGWGENDRIVFTDGNSGLFEVSALGGEAAMVLEPGEGELDFHDTSALSDGSGYIFVVHRQEGIDTLALFDGEARKDILQLPGGTLSRPLHSPTGHILFLRRESGGLWAILFSLSGLETTGEPFLALHDALFPSISHDGTLVYTTSDPIAGQMVWVNRQGEVLEKIGDPHGRLLWPSLSPDEKSAALTAGFTAMAGGADIWIYELSTGSRRRLTFGQARAGYPSWSRDGERIAYTSFSIEHGSLPAVKLIASDGGSEAETVAVPGALAYFSPGGESIIYSNMERGNFDIWHLSLQSDEQPQSLLSTDFHEACARISPDGRYFAYQSNESGSFEIYLKTYPGGEGMWLVSVDGGITPHWSRRGDKLFYFRENDLMEVDVSTSPSLTLGTPRKLFRHEFCGLPLLFGLSEGFDVSTDGQRFLMVRPAGEGRRGTDITIVENWFSEFR